MRKSIIRIDNVWNNSDAKFAEYAVKLHLKEKKPQKEINQNKLDSTRIN